MTARRLTLIDSVLAPWLKCATCSLHKTRRKVVLYRGGSRARVLLIAEAPGASEDRDGRPLVGPAGRALDRAIVAAGLNPERDVVVTNLVACRPPDNRDPSVEEVYACRHRLDVLLTAVDIRRVVLLGKVSGAYLYREDSRGRGFVELNDGKYAARVTHHPGRLLYERLDVGRRMYEEIVDVLRWAAADPRGGR